MTQQAVLSGIVGSEDWVVGLEDVGIAGETHQLLWAVDEVGGTYHVLDISKAWSGSDMASCLLNHRGAGARPARMCLHGEGGPWPQVAAALHTHGIEAVTPTTGPRTCDHGALTARVGLELLAREQFLSVNEARLRIAEYRLQANQRRQPRFAAVSERLGHGIVQAAYASEAPDILILHLLNWFDDGRLSDEIFAPVGSSYIAAALARDGYQVRLELFRHDGSDQAMPDSIRTAPPRVVGVSATGFEVHELKCLSRTIRKELPDVVIMAGGYCSLDRESLFEDSEIDVVVVGEGEQTVCELVPRLLAGDKLDDVAGILFRNAAGEGERTPPRPDVTDMDSLPKPRYSQVPEDTGMVRIAASRGCPYRCVFCSIQTFYTSRRIRYHGPEYVQELLAGLIPAQQGEIRHVLFNDDEFLLQPDHFRRMADVAREGDWTLSFETRVTDVIKFQDVIAENRDVLFQVHMGVESFSQGQLDRWQKRVTVAQNVEATQLLAELGIFYVPYLILSDAETTIGELRENCDGIVALPPCPLAVVLDDGSRLTLSIPPLRRGVRLNRMLDFHGRSLRAADNMGMDAVWQFLLATESDADSLTGLYRGALAAATAADDPGSEEARIVDRIGTLIDDRIARLPGVVAEARGLHDARQITALAQQHTEDYRRRSLLVTLDHLTSRQAHERSTIANRVAIESTA